MNERIRKLARQSTGAGTIYMLEEEWLKFAELIIRECAVYVKNSNCFTYASQADLCAERMKEHFGVE